VPLASTHHEKDHHIPLWRLPDGIATHRLQSVVVAYDPHPVSLELLQRSLNHLCTRATSLQEVIFRIHGCDHPSGALDLRPLLQLRHLRVIRFCSGLRGGWEEAEFALPGGEPERAYFQCSGCMSTPISSSEWDELEESDAAACSNELHLVVPLGGVFTQLRHLSLRIPYSTPTGRLFASGELMRSLVMGSPLLETLSLDVARWWRVCDASVQTVVDPLVPLMSAAPALRQVAIVVNALYPALCLKAYTHETIGALLGLHLLCATSIRHTPYQRQAIAMRDTRRPQHTGGWWRSSTASARRSLHPLTLTSFIRRHPLRSRDRRLLRWKGWRAPCEDGSRERSQEGERS
jgi:hypothetical protein